jgi:hypothetical protein
MAGFDPLHMPQGDEELAKLLVQLGLNKPNFRL